MCMCGIRLNSMGVRIVSRKKLVFFYLVSNQISIFLFVCFSWIWKTLNTIGYNFGKRKIGCLGNINKYKRCTKRNSLMEEKNNRIGLQTSL